LRGKQVLDTLYQRERKELLKRPAFEDLKGIRRSKENIYKIFPISHEKGKRIQKRVSYYVYGWGWESAKIDFYLKENIYPIVGDQEDKATHGDDLGANTILEMMKLNERKGLLSILDFNFNEKGWTKDKIDHFIFMGFLPDRRKDLNTILWDPRNITWNYSRKKAHHGETGSIAEIKPWQCNSIALEKNWGKMKYKYHYDMGSEKENVYHHLTGWVDRKYVGRAQKYIDLDNQFFGFITDKNGNYHQVTLSQLINKIDKDRAVSPYINERGYSSKVISRTGAVKKRQPSCNFI